MSTMQERGVKAKKASKELIEQIPALLPCGKSLTKLIVASAKQKHLVSDELLTVLYGINLTDEEMDMLYDAMVALEIDTSEEPKPTKKDLADAEKQIEKEISDPSMRESLDARTLYLEEMSKIPLLTPEEERSLLLQIEEGKQAQKKKDEALAAGHALTKDTEEGREVLRAIRKGLAAKDKMIESNLRLVVSIAIKYQRNGGVPFMDLVQEGNIGLMHALEKFDVSRNNKFSTFAVLWIRQTVTRALAAQGKSFRVPIHLYETISKITRVRAELESKLGRSPTDQELADACGVPVKKIRYINKNAKQSVSLYTPISPDSSDSTSLLVDMIADDASISPEDCATHSLLQSEMKEFLKLLTPREEKVLRVRYGLEDDQMHTLDDVGKEFGLTRERIRQIEAGAIAKLAEAKGITQMSSYLT